MIDLLLQNGTLVHFVFAHMSEYRPLIFCFVHTFLTFERRHQLLQLSPLNRRHMFDHVPVKISFVSRDVLTYLTVERRHLFFHLLTFIRRFVNN